MDNLPKQDLRKEMLEKRSSLTAEYKKEAAEKIAAYIADVINTKNADRVLVLSFAAYNNEPDTELICDIITDMCEYSIDFAYPKVYSKELLNKNEVKLHIINEEKFAT